MFWKEVKKRGRWPAQYLMHYMYSNRKWLWDVFWLCLWLVVFWFYFIIVLAVQMPLNSMHWKENNVQTEQNPTRGTGTTKVLFKKGFLGPKIIFFQLKQDWGEIVSLTWRKSEFNSVCKNGEFSPQSRQNRSKIFCVICFHPIAAL